MGLANSSDVYEILLTNKLSISGQEYEMTETYIDKENEGIYTPSTKEWGWTGHTILKSESNNGNVQIIINQSLSMLGRAETFSHEALGHGFFIATNRDANHQPGKNNNGFNDLNTELKQQILNRMKVTRNNFGVK